MKNKDTQPPKAAAIQRNYNQLDSVSALKRLRILDSAPEDAFDHIVKIASRVFDVPTVLVSLIDLNRQWFKARVGLDICETDLDVSICRHAVKSHEVMVVKDATTDPRFKSNPFVAAEGGIRFYAGAPLRLQGGVNVGTLCLIDNKPREEFGEDDRRTLEEMARLVVELMEGRAKAQDVMAARLKLQDFTSIAVDIFWETDARHRFSEISFNDGAYDCPDMAMKARKDIEAMIGFTFLEVEAQDETREPWANFGRTLQALQPFKNFRFKRHVNGSTRHYLASGKPVFVDQKFVGYRGVTQDVTAEETARLDAIRLANVDTLTELANRRNWNATLKSSVARKERRPDHVLLLDVDRFKDVNDALGHAAGDHLLVVLSQRLRACAGDARLIARLGGDEFAILIPGDGTPVEEVANCIMRTMCAPIEFEGQTLRIGVSIGINSTSNYSDTSDIMLGADLALRSAKEAGRGQWAMFEDAMREQTDRRVNLISQLSRAIDKQEFELFYQPQIQMINGNISGMEALLRWQHPEKGLLTPDYFLEAIETSSAETDIGRVIIDQACAQTKRWLQDGLTLRTGINVSAGQLYGDNLVSCVADALSRHAIPPNSIEVEITERVALGDLDRVSFVLDGLREIGVSIAFDDFGTGFASLSSLAKFPLDRVKIDRSFISGVGQDHQKTSLTESLISMCQNLNLAVIAEGVENEAQEAFLRENGCDEVQGFFYGRPMSAAAATEYTVNWASEKRNASLKMVS